MTHAESDVLEYVAETGLLGVAALIWLGRGLWRRARRNLRGVPGRSGVVRGAFAAVVALLFYSLYDFNLRVPSNALAFATLLGLLIARDEEPRQVPRWLLRGVACLALLLLAAFAGRRSAALAALEDARAASDGNARLRLADTALSRDPGLPEAYRLRADAQVRLAGASPAGRRLASAERDLDACLELRPHWAEAWADLGRVRAWRGDAAGAGRAFERAVELDPTHIGISVARAVFLATAAGRTRALEELRRLEEANPGLDAARAEPLARHWLGDVPNR